MCGTPQYSAPEIFYHQGYGVGVDYWALGCLIYEMLCGYPPFDDSNFLKIIEQILMYAHNKRQVGLRRVRLVVYSLCTSPLCLCFVRNLCGTLFLFFVCSYVCLLISINYIACFLVFVIVCCRWCLSCLLACFLGCCFCFGCCFFSYRLSFIDHVWLQLSFPKWISKDAKDLIVRLLTADLGKR